ncbi:hypothetical protein BH10ACT8_BH10ACT8_20790 [soil metagenome]|jgi:8-oxo-dGTP diphosphatase
MSYPRILRVSELIRTTDPQARKALGTLPGRLTVAMAELPAGVLVTVELRRPWWDRRPRRAALAGLQRVLDRVRADEHVMVVGVALIRNGRVLSAQRNHPPELAGRWEFPGGKVEKGESLQRALVRECKEELDVAVVVGDEIGRRRLDAGATLVLFAATLADPLAEPAALEHQELRWLARSQVLSVDWLPANREFTDDVMHRL